MKIIKPESIPPNIGPTDYFTGTVRIRPLIQGEAPSCMTCACVTFDPSAHSAWHTHPKGQILVVTEGSGFVQEWEKPVQKIIKGDVIWTPPGIKHWHGASHESSMTHIAIQEALDGTIVNWLEKVTDEQYQSALRV